jgi:hypothetical protein
VLPDVLAVQLVLWTPVQRGGKIQDRSAKARVPQREIILGLRPTQIDV